MKRKIIIVCILTLFSTVTFGQAVISKADEVSSAVASNIPGDTQTPSSTGTPVSIGTVSLNNNQYKLKNVGSYKNENFEYSVVKDDTHKYIELSYYIGNQHNVTVSEYESLNEK